MADGGLSRDEPDPVTSTAPVPGSSKGRHTLGTGLSRKGEGVWHPAATRESAQPGTLQCNYMSQGFAVNPGTQVPDLPKTPDPLLPQDPCTPLSYPTSGPSGLNLGPSSGCLGVP